jgi:hypothetical protein
MARLVGVTTLGLPSPSTAWIATATVRQLLQLEVATAAFPLSTVSPVTWAMAMLDLVSVLPSLVLTSTTRLS